MRYKPEEINIPPDEPFKNDKLKRVIYVKTVFNIVNNINDAFVLSINGKFGSGKTTFLKMLKAHMELNSYKTVYFNAWQNDYLDDPLPALIAEITEIFPAADKIKSKLLEAGKKLIRVGLPIAVKAATMGILDINADVKEAIASFFSSYSSEMMNDYLEIKKNLSSFKCELDKAVKHLSAGGTKIAIFIDELDRCKPAFSLRVLEVAKHIFDIPGICFILGVDEDQLHSMVKATYGEGTNCRGYLKRFIDLNYEIPEPNIELFYDHLFSSLDFGSFFQNRKKYAEFAEEQDLFRNVFIGLAKLYALSLRDIEKCFIRISLIFLSTKENTILFPPALAFLLILKFTDGVFYNKMVTKETDLNGIIAYFKQIDDGEDFLFDDRNRHGSYLLAYLVTLIADDNREKTYAALEKLIADETDVKRKETYEWILDRAKHVRAGASFKGTMKFLDKKISLIEQMER